MNRFKIFLIFTAFSQFISAQDTLKLVCNNFYDWRKVVNTDSCVGIDIDVWRAIADRLNLKIVMESCETLECMYDLLYSGAADVSVSFLKTEERERYMHFIEPPVRTKWYFRVYVNSSNNKTIKNYEDFRGLKVGINDSTYGPRFYRDCFIPDTTIKKIVIKKSNEYFQELIDGGIDAYISSDWRTDMELEGFSNKDKIKIADYHISEYHPCYFVMSRKSRYFKEIDRFSNTINDLLLEGKIKEIILKYYPKYYD